jgi:hypothetical protein
MIRQNLLNTAATNGVRVHPKQPQRRWITFRSISMTAGRWARLASLADCCFRFPRGGELRNIRMVLAAIAARTEDVSLPQVCAWSTLPEI